ncbi:hypothetical protein J6590_074191, partial [Homalodisca vitripennis]
NYIVLTKSGFTEAMPSDKNSTRKPDSIIKPGQTRPRVCLLQRPRMFFFGRWFVGIAASSH